MLKSNAAKHVGFKPVNITFTRNLYSLGAYIMQLWIYILLLFIINHYQDLNVIIFYHFMILLLDFQQLIFAHIHVIVRNVDFPSNQVIWSMYIFFFFVSQ